MTLYIIRHVSKGQVFYRTQSEHDKGWTSALNNAEVYGADEVPDAFLGMAVSVDVVDGKLVMS